MMAGLMRYSVLFLSAMVFSTVSVSAATIQYKDGVYEGQYVRGKNNKKLPHGQGEFRFNSGSRYVGGFSHGKMAGRGTYYYSSGTTCRGEFSNGKISSYGVCNYSSGNVYKGNLVKSVRQGEGTMTFASGGKYRGQWAKGKLHGQGKMTYSSGASYTGQWRNGKRNGEGSYRTVQGNLMRGYWQDNQKHGPFYIEFRKNGKINFYCGLYRNDQKVRIERFGNESIAVCYDKARRW